MTKEKIILFDTTLRDWEQCPWASIWSKKEFLEILEEISRTWIDIIEAWFPSANPIAFDRVYTASTMAWSWEIQSDIAGLCQLRKDQVKNTIEALLPAWKKWILHTYFPVDPNLKLASVWNVDDKKIIENTYEYIKMAKDSWLQVQFSPEWYSRQWSNFDFTTKLIEAAMKAGVDFINCPDTIWWASKYEWEKYFINDMIKHKKIIDELFPWNNAIWSMHNHNDYWLAVDNSINWIVDWIALKVEWTIWWPWERAWNTDLIEFIMIVKHFLWDKFDLSHINTKNFRKLWKLVSESMLEIQKHYPHIWENSFRHTSWWHTNAIRKNPTVYQPYNPTEVWWDIELVFWPLSWWGLAQEIIEKWWYICEKHESAEISQFIKEKSKDRYKWITDNELIEIYKEYRSPLFIDSFSIENNKIKIIWNIFWEKYIELDIIENSYIKTLKLFIENNSSKFKVLEYNSKSDEEWIDSKAISTVKIEVDKKEYIWTWTSENIDISYLKGLSEAYNNYYIEKNFKK